jgi:hypothetical protein
MRTLYLLCALAGVLAAGAHPPPPDAKLEAAIAELNPLQGYSSQPTARDANISCELSCNDEEVGADNLLGSDVKTCVGTFKVFCKGNGTHGRGFYAAKCEGKTTATEADGAIISVCEGAFRNLAKASIRPNSSDYARDIKIVRAYGCLGTTTAIKANRSRSDDASLPSAFTADMGFEDAGQTDMVSTAASNLWSIISNDTLAEARCDGLNGRFFAVSGGKGPHVPKGDDKPEASHDMLHAVMDRLEGPPYTPKTPKHDDDMSHPPKHDKHDDDHKEHGKHHHDDDDDDEHEHGHHEHDKHEKHDQHKDKRRASRKLKEEQHKGWKDGHKDCNMTFEKLEGKVEKIMRESGMSLGELPFGTEVAEGAHPPFEVDITCNGRPAFLKGFFPCLGKFEVTVESDKGSITSSCQGFYTGAIGKTCMGFSATEADMGGRKVFDFCSGRKAVRGGGRPGMGIAMGSWCKGKDLYIAQRADDQ